MVPPLMKLSFVQGPRPREGDSLEYKPGSTIRIGRIARGNDIAIKDAGISTKHLRIVSDSENWILHDLGSSNGTILNSETIDADTPVNLSHGDVIKLGEYTSFVVNFETHVQPQEHKLPPKPRRNNRRQAVVDLDSDLDPIESVQEKPKPKRRGRPPKQDQNNLSERTRATTSITLEEDTADNEKEIEVNSRVSRSQKNVAITTGEEVPVEKKENSRAQRGKNTKNVQNLGVDSIKLETEEIPKVAEVSAMKKRSTKSKHVDNACSELENINIEDNAIEEKKENRTSRATRSNKKEIGGDSFLELEMILKQARATKKKTELKPSKNIEVESLNIDVEEDREIEAQKSSSKRSDKEDEKCKSKEAEIETSDGGCNKNVEKKNAKVDLEKMTLGEWFDFMENHLREQIVEETDKMIDTMRIKSQRVHNYIAEQKQTKGKGHET